MKSEDSIPKAVAISYAIVWRWLLLSVQRYGSLPTGELLAVLTIVVLDRAGYHPTVTDLADITGMPKSSISRYVSDQMSQGFVEEYIDAEDRRRRRLRPTKAAREEGRGSWNAGIEAAYEQAVSSAVNPTLRPDAPIEEVIDYLKLSMQSGLPRVNNS